MPSMPSPGESEVRVQVEARDETGSMLAFTVRDAAPA